MERRPQTSGGNGTEISNLFGWRVAANQRFPKKGATEDYKDHIGDERLMKNVDLKESQRKDDVWEPQTDVMCFIQPTHDILT